MPVVVHWRYVFTVSPSKVLYQNLSSTRNRIHKETRELSWFFMAENFVLLFCSVGNIDKIHTQRTCILLFHSCSLALVLTVITCNCLVINQTDLFFSLYISPHNFNSAQIVIAGILDYLIIFRFCVFVCVCKVRLDLCLKHERVRKDSINRAT